MRGTAKWACTATSVALLVMLLGSHWLWITWGNGPQTLGIETYRGGCKVLRPYISGAQGFEVDQFLTNTPLAKVPWCWWFGHTPWVFYSPYGQTNGDEINIPLWLPVLLAGLPAVLLWRSDFISKRRCRRSRAGLCPSCGYDRRGLATPTDKCPECGQVGTVTSEA